MQQDDYPKHTFRLCPDYLKRKEKKKNKLKLMAWPLQSPDVNLMKLVWAELDRKIKMKQPTSASDQYTML